MSFAGKTAIITGACGGLGRSIAEEFLSQGANIVVCDINKELIADFTSKVASKNVDRTLVLDCNITDDSAIDTLFAETEKKFGALDILVNSAGMMDKFDPVGELERSWLERVMALNVTAPTMLTNRAVNVMLKAGKKGSIVNIASIAGLRGFCAGTAYTMSKHAVIGLTKNVGAYYGEKGIRCNAIAAGPMKTNIAKDFMQGGLNMDGMAMMQKAYPDYNTFVETDKVAKLVLYLSSEAGEIMNGAILTADTGTTAH